MEIFTIIRRRRRKCVVWNVILKHHAKVDFFKKNAVSLIAVDYKQPGLFKHRNNKDYNMTINSAYLVIMTQHDYNELNTKKVKLKHEELGFESLNQPFKS